MIVLEKKDKEVDIVLQYSSKVGGQPTLQIHATGDFSHHLIEGVFDVLDKLASMENVGHQSDEWIKRRISYADGDILEKLK